jgi:hypothetical protein
MCCEYSTAASHRPLPIKASISSLHTMRALGVIFSIACGVKGGSSAMRANRCRGGSEVIGGAPRSLGGCFSRTATLREEKCSGS